MFLTLFSFLRSAPVIAIAIGVGAQQRPAQAALDKALHLADLYNWADAAPTFAEAEALSKASGDHRNELFARLGRIRADIEREQKPLAAVPAELAKELEDN